MLLVRLPCPQYHIEFAKIFNSEEVQNQLKELSKTTEYLTKVLGRKVSNFEDYQDIYSTLRAEVCINKYTINFIRDHSKQACKNRVLID